MVRERRVLYFSHQEVMDALRLFNATGLDLPDGAVIRTFTLNSEPVITLTITIDTLDREPETQQVLKGPFIAAMMLRYCFEKKIPLPRNADKDLSIVDGDLAMALTI